VNDLSEKEQVEALRSWWQDNGKMVIAGIVIGVGSLVMWNQWKQARIETAEGASAVFQLVGEAVDAGKLDKAEEAAQQLYADYGDTDYAAQGRLAMARAYMNQGRDEDAAQSLRDLLALSDHEELQNIARLRLARIYLYQGKAQDVIDLLLDEGGEAYAASYAEVMGDAYVVLGSRTQAADAYARALSQAGDVPTINRALVQMKLNDLAQAQSVEAVPATSEVTEGESEEIE
jgi:predicted negative regulator of RcsB-dependent stress response